VALDAARLAGDYLRGEYERFTPMPDAKSDISTHADRGSQLLIFQHLAEKFPLDGLCGEEAVGEKSTGTSGRVWVIDPIDGTRGFAMKNGEFSTMIGLSIAGEVVVGVVLEPALNRVTYARRGGGCWTQSAGETPRECFVSKTSAIGGTLIQSRSKSRTPAVAALNPTSVLEMYSAGVKLAAVARGDADIYVNTYPNFRDWDICAGHILVTEAGGQVCGLRGEPLHYGGAEFAQRLGLVGSNGVETENVLRALANVPLI
jgi:3'(2'), 5'-bisphosphate nucleotidase